MRSIPQAMVDGDERRLARITRASRNATPARSGRECAEPRYRAAAIQGWPDTFPVNQKLAPIESFTVRVGVVMPKPLRLPKLAFVSVGPPRQVS